MEVLADERRLYHLSHPYSTILQVVTSSMQTVIFHIFPHYRYCSVYLTFFVKKALYNLSECTLHNYFIYDEVEPILCRYHNPFAIITMSFILVLQLPCAVVRFCFLLALQQLLLALPTSII